MVYRVAGSCCVRDRFGVLVVIVATNGARWAAIKIAIAIEGLTKTVATDRVVAARCQYRSGLLRIMANGAPVRVPNISQELLELGGSFEFPRSLLKLRTALVRRVLDAFLDTTGGSTFAFHVVAETGHSALFIGVAPRLFEGFCRLLQ